MESKQFYTIKEVQSLMGICEGSVRKLISEGEMPAIRISARRIIIPVQAFEAWVMKRAAVNS